MVYFRVVALYGLLRSIIIAGTSPIGASIDGNALDFPSNVNQVYYNYGSMDESPLFAFANAGGATALAYGVSFPSAANIQISMYCPTGRLDYTLNLPNPEPTTDTYYIPYDDFQVGYGNCPYNTLFSIVSYVRGPVPGGPVSGRIAFLATAKVCVPNCDGKECGADECGGECGVCANNESCNAEGVCDLLQILPVTLANAVDITVEPVSDAVLNINNVYDVSTNNPETPNDACFAGTSNPIWYHVLASSYQRTITVSTCETQVDTVVGAFLADGTRIACNDDRDSTTPGDCQSTDCNGLSSYIQFANNINTDFYIVVSGISPLETGDIDLRIQSEVEIADLIEESTNIVVDSLTQQLATVSGALTSQITGLSDNVNTLGGSLSSSIGALSTSVGTQFGQLNSDIGDLQNAIQSDLGAFSNSLSSQISDLSDLLLETPDDISAIAQTVNTISTNVGVLQTDLTGLTSDVSTVNGNVQTISSTLTGVSNNVLDVSSDVALLSDALGDQNTLLLNLQTALNTDISGVNGNIDALSNTVSTGFQGVGSSVAGVNTVAQNILGGVTNGNTVTNNIHNFIQSAYFESYLLAGTTAIDAIPWKWRTPAAANGSMDDILAYLTGLYQSKLDACPVSVTSAPCVSFRQNAIPAFSTLQSSYNTQVATLKYKKAFQLLQTFYTKLFPTALFV